MSMHKGLLGQSEGGASVKQDGTPGFDRHPYLKHSTADQSLGDYIHRKYRNDAFNSVNAEKKLVSDSQKLTFEEWFEEWYKLLPMYKGFINRADMKAAWQAGQKNK
jgi:hypothetical protein